MARSLALIGDGNDLKPAVEAALLEIVPELQPPPPGEGEAPPSPPPPLAESNSQGKLLGQEGVEEKREGREVERAALVEGEEAEAISAEMEQMGGVDNATGATVGLTGGSSWKGELNRNLDHHTQVGSKATRVRDDY